MIPNNRIKRSYKHVKTKSSPDGEVIFLDDESVKTPEHRVLVLPHKHLAKEIQKEWLSQREYIDLENMPMTKLSNTAIDKILPNRLATINQILTWVDFDLLCYRVDGNSDLFNLQELKWMPHLQWLDETIGIKLNTTKGITHISQSNDVLDGFRSVLDEYDHFWLVAFIELVKIFGSFVLTLRVIKGELDCKIAFDDSLLEEKWQRSKWGYDIESEERLANIYSDVKDVNKFLVFLQR